MNPEGGEVYTLVFLVAWTKITSQLNHPTEIKILVFEILISLPRTRFPLTGTPETNPASLLDLCSSIFLSIDSRLQYERPECLVSAEILTDLS